MKKKLTFTELGRINLAQGREVVISKVNETGNVSITHSVQEKNENGEDVTFFLKNSTVLTPEKLNSFMNILATASSYELMSKATSVETTVSIANKKSGKKVK